jgi:hypothetical protein
MDHEIAGRELGCVRDDLFGLAPPALRARQTLPEYVGLADATSSGVVKPCSIQSDQRDGVVRKLRASSAIRHGEAPRHARRANACSRATGSIGGDGTTAAGLALAPGNRERHRTRWRRPTP